MGLNAELRIPDLWYDSYTRLLPGTTFVVCFRQFVLGEKSELTWLQVSATLGVGYFCGLLVAPLGSRLTGWILELIGQRDDVEDAKIRLGRHEAMILSKMQGECCFFVQLSVLCAVFLILYYVDELRKEQENLSIVWLTGGLLVFCLLASIDVAARRAKRANFKLEALKRCATGGTPPPTSSGCSPSVEEQLS